MKFSAGPSSLIPSATLSISSRAKEMKKDGRDVIALSAGQPDFPTPEPVIEAAKKAMEEGKTGYTASSGIPELRECVAIKYSKKRGMDFKRHNVIISCGAKHCMANLLCSVIKPGDRILVPRPYWVSYPEMIKLYGGIPVYPESSYSGINGEDVATAIEKDDIKGILLNSPTNPTGFVLKSRELLKIAEIMRENPEVWVISDDIYEDIFYEIPEVPHILDVAPDLADRVAMVSGVSKTYSMTGWRIGYSLAEMKWTSKCSLIQAHTTSNPCSIAQWAALAAVEGKAEKERIEMLEAFRRRRELILDLLDDVSGIQLDNRPQGAFYVFPEVDIGNSGMDTSKFCKELLEQESLAVIPGYAFGSEGFIRLSFAASDDDITRGIDRLSRFMGGAGHR